ncbi:molybdopterin molybdenumtransferase MoeA [Arcobacter sp. CECT 8983]|uniref:molybdopterin molybdotransferase MoeA n=1 Tax=Arcobacter sp. CECT 8983 TaxID=2044508 RepID=UPI00100BA809|nr:molybdopterin molybdotransferase MoeA [Arcobacter sp. CECT 8983]RXJ88540.1 molybdopterin molybdenumtransferase MoeA [Arcobacter sp. CECT 8983]
MALSVNNALKIISELSVNPKFEIIPIEESINRICAQDIKAKLALPRFNNSAMDGYGFKLQDIEKELKVIDSVFAGDNKDINLQEATCIKIMTGAVVPDDVNVIAPKENCQILENGNIIVKDKNLKEYSHIRFVGEDVNISDKVLSKGDEINFANVTLLSSQGISYINVYKRPKIVVFSSGEELKLHYEKIEDHQIYNSNTPTLLTRCKEFNCDVTFIGQARDSIKSLEELITNSLDADLIVTSGGVSVGDADFTNEAFLNLGFEQIFKGIEIKPGKPTIFGKIKNTYILNLPGNPLASALIFEVFGKVLLQKLLGSNLIHHKTINAKLGTNLKNKKGRITIIPGLFDGEYFFPEDKRLPGMVSTLSKSNCMIALNEDVSFLQKEAEVKLLPINWKFFRKDYKDFLTYE